MDLHGQGQRKRQLIEKLCRHALDYYAADGSFHGPFTQPDERDKYRLAAVLVEHGGAAEVALAETLIRGTFGGPENDVTKLSLEENIIDLKRGLVRDWNIFQSNIATILLARHGGRLSPEIADKCRRIARRNVSRFAGSGQADYFFHGANDNMPAHATAGLVIAGQLLDDQQAIGDGRYHLQMFAEMLSRRGLCGEFSSGTYLPITVGGMAEVADLARDEEIRRLALQIEHQLWADVVCHYHPGSGKNAGPQTRAYTVNTIAHLDCIMLLLWVATGEPAFCDPVRDIITLQPKQVTHFEGDAFKTACGLVYAMTPEFHFPEHLGSLLTERQYPYRFYGTGEQMYAGIDVGGRECYSTVYQTADYSLATSSHGFMTGNQSEKVRITYRRVEEPQSFKDTGILFARLLYNDEIPGIAVQQENCAPGEQGLVHDRALARTLQLDDTALYLSRGHEHNVTVPITLHRIRQTVILPAHYHDVEAAYIGTKRVEDFTGSSATAQPVFLDLGRLYLALYPLTLTNHGRTDLIRLESLGDYRMVSFFNYEGEPREFDAAALQSTFNGFVVQVSGPAECGSFDQFRANWKLDLVEDWWLANNRRTRVIVRGNELLLNWSTPSDTMRSETINGRLPRRERLWTDGLDPAQFPLLSGAYTPMPNLHYDSLEVAWYPDLKWQIGERATEVTAESEKEKEKV
ncbi:MAG: hypothetical protein ACYC7E_00995 [Armatimonadota bacterium]